MERRLFVRFSMSGTVVIQPEQKNLRAIDCELIDISFEGIGFYSPEQLKEKGLAKFVLVNRQLNVNVSGIGQVAYCLPVRFNDKAYFRVGIEFVDVDSQLVRKLLHQIRDLSPES